MLTKNKKNKLFLSLKQYHKQFLNNNIKELDESGTRLMVNSFLTDVLGYAPIEEVKTEYMIRGTYADYVIQLQGERHFLVEVKALSFNLSDKHLRQATNYGANEGIEWALLTNGKTFDFYKILFNKPIESKRVFSIDLSDINRLKLCIETIQYLHKDSISNKGLDLLWNKCLALDPTNVAGLFYAQPVLNFIKRSLKKKFKTKFSDDEVENSINRILNEVLLLDNVRQNKPTRERKKRNAEGDVRASLPQQNIPLPTSSSTQIPNNNITVN